MERSNLNVHITELFNKKNLRFKIILLFVLILILPLAILTIISLSRTKDVSQKNLERDISHAVSLFRETLDDRLESLKLRAKTLTDFELDVLAMDNFPEKEVKPILESELLKSDLDYIAIVENKTFAKIQMGKFGDQTLSNLLFPSICQSSLDVNLYVINDIPWIFASAKFTKLVSPIPMHLVFAQKLNSNFCDKLKGITDAEFTIYQNNKKLITTQMDAYARRNTGKPIENAELANGRTEILGKSHYFIHDLALPDRVSADIKIEIALPDAQYTELGNKLQKDFLIFGLLGLALALINGLVLSRNIAKPINQLAAITSKVAAGDLNIENTICREDEIGTLSKNFTEMVQSIKEEKEQKETRMKELHTLFEISNAVNLFTSSDDLLKFVLSHAIEILQAERGSIMLLDDQTDELVLKVATGGRYRVSSSTPIKLGTGVCGKVALEGEGIISNQGFKDSRFKNFGSLMPVEDIQTLICAPLKFKEGTIGVINIVNKKDGQLFNENDLSLLTLIGSQAAVTIENNKLYELSITDGMTKLFVHRYFQARLTEELLRARRYGLSLSMIMIDIDNFKKFNDTYGHQTGDQVIQKVAASIKDSIRTGIDIPCRYGGEEMCIILPETRADDAFITAERVRKNIADFALAHASGDLHVTCSIGVASYPTQATDKASLIKASDAAMYASKKAGKNRTTIADNIG